MAFSAPGGTLAAKEGEARKQAFDIPRRKLGALEISAVGLGCLPMVGCYGGKFEKKDMVNLIRQAVDRGVTFFDTAEVCGPCTSEERAGEALEPVRSKMQTAPGSASAWRRASPRPSTAARIMCAAPWKAP